MRLSFERRMGAGLRRQAPLSLVLFLIAGILALVAGGMFLAAGALDADAALLAREGQEVQAEVLDRRITERIEVDRDKDLNSPLRERKVTTYHLRLAYVTAAGERIETEVAVSRARYEAAETGGALRLFYAPSKPTVIEFERGEAAAEARAFRWVFWGLGVLSLGLAGLGVWLRRRERAG